MEISIQNIDYQWVKDMMKKHSITTLRELANIMQVPENELSRKMKNNKGLTQWHKPLFYYTFKYLEIKKELEVLKEKTKNNNGDQLETLDKLLTEIKTELDKLKQ